MPLNFPPAPLTVGQQYTFNAITWFWNGSAWELLTATDASFGTLTATSYNKVAITAPATSATLTIADGKTFTVNNTITLEGTDSTTITLPATTGTVPLDDQEFYVGTTSLTINRASAVQSLTGITSIDGYAAGLAGGNNTTLLGSLPYQSDANTTSLLSPNTTTTRNFLRMTGDGTNGTAPAWDTVTQTDVGLSEVTNESKATMFTDPTFTGTVSLAPATFESVNVSAGPGAATVNVDVKTNTVFYYTANANTNWTFNFRGDGSTTLDTYLGTNKSLTVVFLVTNGVTAYYPTAFTVDGSAVTPKWLSGTTPSGGNASSIDSYSFTIIKTAAATYTILASQARFA